MGTGPGGVKKDSKIFPQFLQFAAELWNSKKCVKWEKLRIRANRSSSACFLISSEFFCKKPVGKKQRGGLGASLSERFTG